jgi:hypothetical protein
MPSKNPSVLALQAALRAARDNEARWMEMSPSASDDFERADFWASTAKLRRKEVERLERLIVEVLPESESLQ